MKITATLTLEGDDLGEVMGILHLIHEHQAAELTLTNKQVDDESWKVAPSTGWTLEHVELLRAGLFANSSVVQLASFDQAIANGGHVSRTEVFQIGKYSSDRKLNNWTARFRKITDKLVAEHGLPEDAESPIEPDYGPGNGYRPAVGFNVAPEIVKLVRG